MNTAATWLGCSARTLATAAYSANLRILTESPRVPLGPSGPCPVNGCSDEMAVNRIKDQGKHDAPHRLFEGVG